MLYSHLQFSLEIDDGSKILPFLMCQENYTFLPGDMAAVYIRERKLREIKLLDFQTPVINSYIIGKKSKKTCGAGFFLLQMAKIYDKIIKYKLHTIISEKENGLWVKSKEQKCFVTWL